MKLIYYWLISILFLIPYFNNIAYCQNRMSESELENINGPGKPKAKVFKYDNQTGEFTGISFFKKSKGGYNNILSFRNKRLEKSKKIDSKINRLGIVMDFEGRGILSSDEKYYVSVDAPNGEAKTIYFFNSNGILLNKYTIDKPFLVAYDFNSFGTYFMLWGDVSDEFYFFSPSGSLIRKGNFNSFTHDNGTSYWRNEISKTGKIWALVNNSTYLYDERNNLIDKIPAINCAIIYEDLNYILYTKGHNVYIYNYQSHLIEYVSTYIDSNFNITNGKLYILINRKNKLEYEITL